MSMAIWAAATAFAVPICRLAYRVAVLLIAYRLVMKLRDLDAVTKVCDLAGVLGGRPFKVPAPPRRRRDERR
jgi:hypothetical protein